MATSNEYVLVVALDLGTTYSGYAFALKHDKSKIYMNKNWGEKQGYQSYKTPTCVLTGPNNEFVSFGYDAISEYCQYIEEGGKGYNLFKNFKMLLHNNPTLSTSTTVASVSGENKPALDIFAFMVTALKDHCMSAMELIKVTMPSEDTIKWVLTVPAIWTDKAKGFMREVALKAGLIKTKFSDQLVLALEPEAAGLYCKQVAVKTVKDAKVVKINEQVGTGDGILKITKDEKYLVIDAGGGTIDITAYQVLDNFKVKELVASNGGAWGGITVDKKYTELLSSVLGEEFVEECKKNYPLELMKDFELFKKKVRGEDPAETMKIDIPYSLASLYIKLNSKTIDKVIKRKNNDNIGFSMGKVIFRKPNIFFQDTIDEIRHHVTKLLKDSQLGDLSYVMLVGGFGECYMLQQAIRKIIPKNCKLIVPPEAQLTVIKGAIYFGFNMNDITSRIAKMTYGIKILAKFKEGEHDEKHKLTYDTGDWCNNVFAVFIEKGTSVEYGQAITHNYVPVCTNQSLINFDIYCTHETSFTQVVYTDAPNMYKVGNVGMEWSQVEKGLNRNVKCEFWFGGTEIKVTAMDESSGRTAQTSIEFFTEA